MDKYIVPDYDNIALLTIDTQNKPNQPGGFSFLPI